jgi:hypothetical protein
MSEKTIATIADVASEGGKARAESLSPEERSKIAAKAADARWSIPKATHGSPDSPLRIGSIEIPCYVLEGGTRVLTQAGFLEAMGRHRKARVRNQGEDPLPAMIQGKAINPFISKELIEKSRPVVFRKPDGVRAKGYRAEILPEVCEVYLKARDAGVLPNNQEHVAKQAEILIRGLAHVGIIALVDEATGYQEVRDRLALQVILDKFLRREFAAWAKRFPDEFYKEMFRLKGWAWSNMNPAGGPRCIARYTNDLVYARLGPGVLQELQARNPVLGNGRRKAAHHQWLTDEIGHPALAQHLYAVIGLMRIARSWDELKRMIDRAYPKRGANVQLELFDPDADGDDVK